MTDLEAAAARLLEASRHVKIGPGNHWDLPHSMNIKGNSGPEADEFLHALADYQHARREYG